MSPRQSPHKMNGGQHLWGDEDSVLDKPGWRGVLKFALFMGATLSLIFGLSRWLQVSPSVPPSAPLTPPATPVPVALPMPTTPPVVRPMRPVVTYFNYDLANADGGVTLDTDQAKIIFRGASYRKGCGRATESLPLTHNIASSPISIQNGNVTVNFNGHTLQFTHNLTQLKIDNQDFDISRNKLTIAINPDGTTTTFPELTVPLPTPQSEKSTVLYVNSACP